MHGLIYKPVLPLLEIRELFIKHACQLAVCIVTGMPAIALPVYTEQYATSFATSSAPAIPVYPLRACKLSHFHAGMTVVPL